MVWADPEYYSKWQKSKNGVKRNRINKWRCRGIRFPNNDPDAFYDKIYDTCNNCQLCDKELTIDMKHKASTRCLDHDHISGYNRFVCCGSCNQSLIKRDRLFPYVLLELHRYHRRQV